MEKSQELGSKNILRFVMYIALIAVFLFAIFYMLYNAHPREEPKVKESAPSSFLAPAIRPGHPAFGTSGTRSVKNFPRSILS